MYLSLIKKRRVILTYKKIVLNVFYKNIKVRFIVYS